jgi:phospholipid transport system substrate-binding protein
MDEIRVAVTQALQILKEPEMKSNHERKELDARLGKIIDPVFDFREMAKRSLGIHWRDLTPEERQEFVPLLQDFLSNVYLGRIAFYNGEKVRFTCETVGKNYAEVDTQVVGKNGDQVPVVYLVKRKDGDWKVYDVVVDNVSIDNNYRSQFDRVISRSSYQELVKTDQTKSRRELNATKNAVAPIVLLPTLVSYDVRDDTDGATGSQPTKWLGWLPQPRRSRYFASLWVRR